MDYKYKDKAEVCPVCGCAAIDTEVIDENWNTFDNVESFFETRECPDCGCTWDDVYSFKTKVRIQPKEK